MKRARDISERKKYVRSLFDSIVPGYDLLNRVLSFGIDTGWRKKLLGLMGEAGGAAVLDACSGTGDLGRMMREKGFSVVSLDFSLPMLAAGKGRGWIERPVCADASRLPFRNSSFAFITIAFGIRNIPDRENFISDCLMALAPGGRLLILELTRPRSGITAALHGFYLGRILPFIGGALSGRMHAYRYLSDTIREFADPVTLRKEILAGGFSSVRVTGLTFGSATIFDCARP
ncbi:MAG: ubiquinone/menaquinone biosynthesis methyltransferase [Spirochaetes bacterium]|nr:ubiquinone/menaquinone biosynthesis methyltransferase [Spirochaetota bacterium]